MLFDYMFITGAEKEAKTYYYDTALKEATNLFRNT